MDPEDLLQPQPYEHAAQSSASPDRMWHPRPASLVAAAVLVTGLVTGGVAATVVSAHNEDEATKEQTYLAMLASSGISSGTTPQLLQIGQAICQAMDNGHSAEEMLGVTIGDGYTNDEARTIMSAALAEFCPAHQSKLNGG
jgi:hypothetical protein